ncbi:hypothetical protein Zmor_019507 [Zophobas morio]|uniref:Uncharacterized protein n=2 Tax=Zophobas morio TaxID=2755281 RepID=A0AA38I1S4_9CUCU|nr:hypothetical protein Zmor_019507 [Zophobas morio]
MWRFLVLNLYFSYPLTAKSAWVEIPQVPSKKTTPFVFGTPKVSFIEPKFTSTTPSNPMVLTTTPRQTTPPAYREIMTTSTISPLTTARQLERNHNEKPKTPKVQPDKAKNATQTSESAYSGFLPLLQSIQQTLTINAKKSLKNKISVLTNLRDNLLANIDERMSGLWSRSDTQAEARGHDDEMDFPSNEGALMTIGFLTFAVFLIKLVLKLVHALKSKQAPVVVTTIAPATAFIGRKKRDVEDSLKILQFIEEYKFR